MYGFLQAARGERDRLLSILEQLPEFRRLKAVRDIVVAYEGWPRVPIYEAQPEGGSVSRRRPFWKQGSWSEAEILPAPSLPS